MVDKGARALAGSDSQDLKGDENLERKEAPPIEIDGCGEKAIDTMFGNLEIEEDEYDDFILEDEEVDLVESARWLAVARVFCQNKFSHEAFFSRCSMLGTLHERLKSGRWEKICLYSSVSTWQIGRK
jgi:hypothetical protein